MIRCYRQWEALLRAELRSALPVAGAATGVLMIALVLIAAIYGETADRFAAGVKVFLGAALATLPIVALVFDGGTRLDTVTRAAPTRRWVSFTAKVASIALVFATIAALAWVCDLAACTVVNRIVPESPIAHLGESIQVNLVFWGWIVMTYSVVAIAASQTRSALGATMLGLVYVLALCMIASQLQSGPLASGSLLLDTTLVHAARAMQHGATLVGGTCALVALAIAFQRRGALGRAPASRAVVFTMALGALFVAPILARSAARTFASPVEFDSIGSRVEDVRTSPDRETLALLIHDAKRQATSLWFVDVHSGTRTQVRCEPLERWSKRGIPLCHFDIDGWSSVSDELTVRGRASSTGHARRATFTSRGTYVEDCDPAETVWDWRRRTSRHVGISLWHVEGEEGRRLVARLGGHEPVTTEFETELGVQSRGRAAVNGLTAEGVLQRWFLATGTMEELPFHRRWEQSQICFSLDGRYALERGEGGLAVLTSLEDGRTRALALQNFRWTKCSGLLLEHSQGDDSRWVLHSIEGEVELEFARGATRLIDVDGEQWLMFRGNENIDLHDASGRHVRRIR